jgi:hypothetical protein
MPSKLKDGKLDKENFIEQLSSATPEDLNRMILERGKPPKLYSPIYFYRGKYQFDENGGIINERHLSGRIFGQ